MTLDSAVLDRPLPFWFKVLVFVDLWLRETGRMVGGVSRDGAVRRRWGAIARIAFAIRKARRGRKPCLPVRELEQVAGVATKNNEAATVVAAEADCDPPALPAPARMEELHVCGSSRRGRVALLAPGRRELDAARSREALAHYDDITDCGNRFVVMTVRSREWRRECFQQHALDLARSLDVLPRERCPLAWTTLVCSLVTVLFVDLSPEFERVCRRAADEGDFSFSAVPLRGSWNWRRRAKFAGYV